jgi:hypothetical protein
MLRQFIGTEKKTEPLDDQIAAVLKSMTTAGPDSEEYPKLLEHLERLHQIKTKSRRDPVSLDTVVSTAGTLLGILAIVAYEQKHVMVSKGFGWIPRPKLQNS